MCTIENSFIGGGNSEGHTTRRSPAPISQCTLRYALHKSVWLYLKIRCVKSRELREIFYAHRPMVKGRFSIILLYNYSKRVCIADKRLWNEVRRIHMCTSNICMTSACIYGGFVCPICHSARGYSSLSNTKGWPKEKKIEFKQYGGSEYNLCIYMVVI